jgi:hypothetical protein
MHRFSGTFEHAIDDKKSGRHSVKYRDALLGLHQERLMVTRFRDGDRRCLDAYPLSAWEELEAKILAKRRFDRPDAAVQARVRQWSARSRAGRPGCILSCRSTSVTTRDQARCGLHRPGRHVQDLGRATWQRTFDDDEKIFDQPDVLDELDL